MTSDLSKQSLVSRRPVIYPSAGPFLEKTQKGLERREAENSLLLGIALALRSDSSFSSEAAFFATVDGCDGWELASLMTPPYPLALVADDDAAVPEPAVSSLVEYITTNAISLSGVVAKTALATAFASNWIETTGGAVARTVHERVHRLREVSPLPGRSGHLRLAERKDLDLIGRWMGNFQEEALGDGNREGAFRSAERRLAAGDFFVWEDSGPRSMAARSRATRNTISINAVYTPPEWRNQGYATATVAALSQNLLVEGSTMCVLFTDLANPISNRIYARIGYEPVCDFAHIHFGPSTRQGEVQPGGGSG